MLSRHRFALPGLALRVFALTVFALALPAARADSTVGWRTDGTGNYAKATPPLEWSSDLNIRWRAVMPDWSNATPVVVGNRVITTAEPDWLICVDAESGKVLWKQQNAMASLLTPEEVAAAAEREKLEAQYQKLGVQWLKMRRNKNRLESDAAFKAEFDAVVAQREELKAKMDELGGGKEPLRTPPTQGQNGYASCTPVTDGKHVFAMYGSGVAAAFTLEGKRLWLRMVEQPTHREGNSSSPMLVDGKLLILVNKLYALDPATGETLWTANAERAWGTPQPIKIGDTHVVACPNGEVVRVSDGRIIATGLGRLNYSSPLVQDGVLYYIDSRSHAYRIPKTAGDKVEFKELWSARLENDRYYASPLLHDGRIYAITQRGVLDVLDATTGKDVYQQRTNLGGTVYTSVTHAGGSLFVSSTAGRTLVFSPGDAFNTLATNRLSPMKTNPVFVDDRLYLRCDGGLYCITSQASANATNLND